MRIHFKEARRNSGYYFWHSFGPRDRELERTVRQGQLEGVGKSTSWKRGDSYKAIGLIAGTIIGVITGYLIGRYYFAGGGTGAIFGIIIGFFTGSISGRIIGSLARNLRNRP